jgi:hypothetical protein
MNINWQNFYLTNKPRIITAVILAGILSLGGGVIILKNAVADSAKTPLETSQELLPTNQLPAIIADALRQNLAEREGILAQDINIINYQQQTWNNGCLELARADELCTQALVPGWRVVLSDGNSNWTYHTNDNGGSLRLAASKTSPDLPSSVKDAVLQAASQRLQIPISKFNIMAAETHTWRDGCLELAGADEFCTQALVPGWRVTVNAGEETLVYHTNETGSVHRLNEKASTIPNQ